MLFHLCQSLCRTFSDKKHKVGNPENRIFVVEHLWDWQQNKNYHLQILIQMCLFVHLGSATIWTQDLSIVNDCSRATRCRYASETNDFFIKMGQPRPLFGLFSVFSNKQYKFYNNSMWKMSFPSSIQHWDSNPRTLNMNRLP